MIADKQNLFSEDQVITVTVNSTNVIDLGADSARIQDLTEKGQVQVVAQVTTAFAGGTSMSFTLQSDDDVDFGSPTTLFVSAAIATAVLVGGYRALIAALPQISERYLRLTYTVVGTMSAGKVFAGLVLDAQTST